MQDIIAFLAALPLECIVLSVALFFIYMIAIAPVFIGIIAQRRLNAERDKPARRAVYEDGQFYDVEDDNDLIVLDYSRSTECLVTVNLPWAADPIQALVHFKVSDNPDRTGKNCPSNQNSAPHDQWATKNSGAYAVYVYPGVRLSRVVIHLHKSGDQLELVFDQGWETRVLFPLPAR